MNSSTQILILGFNPVKESERDFINQLYVELGDKLMLIVNPILMTFTLPVDFQDFYLKHIIFI